MAFAAGAAALGVPAIGPTWGWYVVGATAAGATAWLAVAGRRASAPTASPATRPTVSAIAPRGPLPHDRPTLGRAATFAAVMDPLLELCRQGFVGVGTRLGECAAAAIGRTPHGPSRKASIPRALPYRELMRGEPIASARLPAPRAAGLVGPRRRGAVEA